MIGFCVVRDEEVKTERKQRRPSSSVLMMKPHTLPSLICYLSGRDILSSNAQERVQVLSFFFRFPFTSNFLALPVDSKLIQCMMIQRELVSHDKKFHSFLPALLEQLS